MKNVFIIFVTIIASTACVSTRNDEQEVLSDKNIPSSGADQSSTTMPHSTETKKEEIHEVAKDQSTTIFSKGGEVFCTDSIEEGKKEEVCIFIPPTAHGVVITKDKKGEIINIQTYDGEAKSEGGALPPVSKPYKIVPID